MHNDGVIRGSLTHRCLKAIKPAFHDSNTNTDVLADSPDIARILARKSGVGVGVVECELDAAHAPICQLKTYT